MFAFEGQAASWLSSESLKLIGQSKLFERCCWLSCIVGAGDCVGAGVSSSGSASLISLAGGSGLGAWTCWCPCRRSASLGEGLCPSWL